MILMEEPTYEGLVKYLVDGQPSIGVFTDEGGRLIGGSAMSRDNLLKTLSGFSGLWDGKTSKPITRVRSSDGSQAIYGRRVAMHLLVQNSVYVILTKSGLTESQGFLNRFYDGNGRTGRIINILYLVKHGLLDTPVLYLSRYINQNKSEYYRLLQAVRDHQDWEKWVLYMLEGVEQTSRQTTRLILGMRDLMQHHKHKLRDELPKIYSQDLLNNLFRHPCTKIDFVMQELQIHRNTAIKYLEELVRIGLLTKHKIGKENFYLNTALYDLLGNSSSIPPEK